MRSIKIGLLGLGTVGSSVIRLVTDHQEDLARQVGSPIEIEKVLVRNRQKDRISSISEQVLTEQVGDIIDHPNIDVVVEVMGGTEPTKQYLLDALERGKHVVTANKDLMALHGREIMTKAQEKGCDVYYEASVAGGIPIIRTLIDGFSSDRIKKIMGIVNGTTNFILTKMSQEGADYAEVLQEAQALGYAESDPSADVEGFDAARKMTILATLGFHSDIALADVDVRGISQVKTEDIAFAKRLGYEMKLLGIAEHQDDRISIAVQPTMIRHSHPLAAVNGVFNAVYVYGEAVGETMFYGPGAGGMSTATSVVADLVAVIKNMKLEVNGRHLCMPYKEKKLGTDEQIMYRNFIWLQVENKPGAFVQITQLFANCGVNLESIVQQPNPHPSAVEMIIITHQTSQARMKKVYKHFHHLNAVQSIKSIYRMEG